jgi:hypothetical protein
MNDMDRLVMEIREIREKQNRIPLRVVPGGTRAIPDFSGRLQVNTQIIILIYEVNTGNKDVELQNIQRNINKALNRDEFIDIRCFPLANRGDVELFLAGLIQYGVDMIYEDIVHELQPHERKSDTWFFIFYPIVTMSFLD